MPTKSSKRVYVLIPKNRLYNNPIVLVVGFKSILSLLYLMKLYIFKSNFNKIFFLQYKSPVCGTAQAGAAPQIPLR